jgi:uncharacterized membrane protein (DUF485 family)
VPARTTKSAKQQLLPRRDLRIAERLHRVVRAHRRSACRRRSCPAARRPSALRAQDRARSHGATARRVRVDRHKPEQQGDAVPAAPDPRIDWEAIEASPEFRQLIAARRRFVLPATLFFLAWYIGFVLLAGYAPDFMGRSVYEGLTVGYCLALTQFVMVFALGLMYLRRSERVYDPLSDRVLARALTTGRGRPPAGGRTAQHPDVPAR